jgi:hypothetical protein
MIVYMGKLGKHNREITTGLEESPVAPAIDGTRTISANLESAFWYQLKQISIDWDIPMRWLIREALNDLFIKYGKETVAAPQAQGDSPLASESMGQGAGTSAGNALVNTTYEFPKQFEAPFEKWMANGWSGTELLRKAFSLFEVAQDAKEHGNRLGVLSRDRQVIAEIIGL